MVMGKQSFPGLRLLLAVMMMMLVFHVGFVHRAPRIIFALAAIYTFLFILGKWSLLKAAYKMGPALGGKKMLQKALFVTFIVQLIAISIGYWLMFFIGDLFGQRGISLRLESYDYQLLLAIFSIGIAINAYIIKYSPPSQLDEAMKAAQDMMAQFSGQAGQGFPPDMGAGSMRDVTPKNQEGGSAHSNSKPITLDGPNRAGNENAGNGTGRSMDLTSIKKMFNNDLADADLKPVSQESFFLKTKSKGLSLKASAGLTELKMTEQRLGHKLPALLRDLYLRQNGGATGHILCSTEAGNIDFITSNSEGLLPLDALQTLAEYDAAYGLDEGVLPGHADHIIVIAHDHERITGLDYSQGKSPIVFVHVFEAPLRAPEVKFESFKAAFSTLRRL